MKTYCLDGKRIIKKKNSEKTIGSFQRDGSNVCQNINELAANIILSYTYDDRVLF